MLAVLPLPGRAQVVAGSLAETVCARPPMTEESRDRLKRLTDYVRLLERLADDCPDVAMIFLDFEVGSIADRPQMRRIDPHHFIDPLGWPTPADRNF